MLLLSYRYFVGLLLVVVCCFAVSFAQSDQRCTANLAGDLEANIFDSHQANAADCQESESPDLSFCDVEHEMVTYDTYYDATMCFSSDEKRQGLKDHLMQLSKTSGKLPVVYYWADWCKPCEKMAPILEASHMAEEIILFKVDIENESVLTKDGEIFGMHDEVRVPGVPAIEVFCSNGKVKQHHGLIGNITHYMKNESCNEQSPAEASE
jgi:thiol-disulfide isomerase/thioredoxin